MNYYLVAPTIIIRKDQDYFTYHHQSEIPVGTLVRFSIGKKTNNGIVVKKVTKPTGYATKPIDDIITTTPLPLALLNLADWIAKYYSTALPVVFQTILPAGLHKKRQQRAHPRPLPIREKNTIILTPKQKATIQQIGTKRSCSLLLHGVTGAGKTQVYIEAAKREQKNNRSTIILVPEIALTSQLVAEFTNHFDNVVLTHSKMSESERHTVWLSVLNSKIPQIVIGPRSALFMPVKALGLIVIDECHEPSFKQEQNPKYSALRVASMLAKLHHNARTVLGSATPSLTDYYIAANGTAANAIVELSTTARKTTLPSVTIADLKNKAAFKEHRFLSDALLSAIRGCLADNRQVLIFHNRRGTATTTLCANCGWSADCKKCYIPLTLHSDKNKLCCHLCGQNSSIPPNCPICSFPDITFKGIGTKQIETEVSRLFPKARISRFDADNNADDTVYAKYQQLYNGEIDIIIGTQLIAKGLDLPKLQAVGIIQADSGLQVPDFQADERVFQLLYQVAGRVGRGDSASQVIIQTYQPDHPTIKLAIARDYATFYKQQLQIRQQSQFPPFTFLLKLTCSYKTEKNAIKAAQDLAKKLKDNFNNIDVLGPTPAFYERLGGNYRWQLIIKSKKRATLIDVVKLTPDNWQSELDPSSLL